MKITGQMIVKNEDRFVRFALLSVLPYLSKVLVYDTGSNDKTVEKIKSLNSPKIEFSEKGPVTPDEMVALRGEQLEKTDTEFFMIIDGDEVWPRKSLEILRKRIEILPTEKLAIVCRTRNAVGDVWHYLPERSGSYQFLGMKGHLTLRVFRKVPGLTVAGRYPLEAYRYNGVSLNNLDTRLEFVDVWYLHATHLVRSTNVRNPKYKYELGLAMKKSELPEVLSGEVLTRRSWGFVAAAGIIEPLKELKRKIT